MVARDVWAAACQARAERRGRASGNCVVGIRGIRLGLARYP